MSALIPSGNATGTGTMTLLAPPTNGTQTVTIPDATGTMMVSGNMPAFSAYQGTQQSVTSGTYTKIAFTVENFDTANCFDSTTNYRFTPTVAGYYQINLIMYGIGTASNYIKVAIYKNGTNYVEILSATQQNANAGSMIGSLIYMNGSTDYIEGYGIVSATSGAQIGVTGSTILVQMSGYLARSA